MTHQSPISTINKPTWPMLATLVAFCAAVLLLAQPVQAQNITLQQAMSELSAMKQQGYIGEKQNGYLGVVNQRNNAATVASLINDARRAEYTRIADQNSIAVSDVEAMAGKRAIERTPAGQYIQLDGQWVVKR